MAFFRRNEFNFTDTSVTARVPENDVARLMFYLHCVCQAIEYNDSDISRYRNYQNYASLTFNEIRTLLILCLMLSPDEFDGKVFFQSDTLTGNFGNRFYKVNQISHAIVAAQSIVIAGQTRQVTKIMTSMCVIS